MATRKTVKKETEVKTESSEVKEAKLYTEEETKDLIARAVAEALAKA